jgi:hypothetical protein
VATSAHDQSGPARIVSISADAERRNVTVAQKGDALIVRLRTPAGGENGQKPELLIPDVFTDAQPRRITVIYDAPRLSVTVEVYGDTYERGEYDLSLAPGVAFFSGFMTENRWQITMSDDVHYYDWIFWGIIVGLAVLVFGGLAAGKRLISTRMGTKPTNPYGINPSDP